MMLLDASWKPGFGQIYTWFAVDKNGLVAMMVNNCYGDLPRALLEHENCNVLLDKVSEYMWEESAEFSSYPSKCGDFILDFYSFWRYGSYSRESLTDKLISDLAASRNYSEVNLPVNKGIFVYHAVEGGFPGDDLPVGYKGETEMGDYFRYLVPTKFSSFEEFPASLRKVFVRSEGLDFMCDRVIESSRINEFFKDVLSSE